MKGVDISHYQDGLTIRQLMDAGKDFAIIKVTEGTGYVDPSSFTFYREAHELGFPLGGYCYSHAMNAQQAMAEAAYLLDTIKGFPMPCGVYLDIEEPEQLALDHDTLVNIIRGWCAAVGGRGYVPGIYSSAGTLWAKVHPDEVPVGCLVWVAKWSDTPPNLPCDLWQNSDHGTIPGYEGPVDTDEARSNYFKADIALFRGYSTKDAAPDACPLDGPCGEDEHFADTGKMVDALAAYMATDEFREGFKKFFIGMV